MDGFTEEDLLVAAEAAIRAPSMHNSQPWRLRLRDGAVEILTDPDRRLAVADRTGWAGRLASGAAVYNARLALAVTGRQATVTTHPDRHDRDLVARLLPLGRRPPTRAERDLHAAVARRYSNRGPFFTDPVPADVRMRLLEAARSELAWLDLLVGMTALTAFAEIAGSADRVLRRDTRYQAEQVTWTHAGALCDPQDLRLVDDRRRTPGRDHEPEPLIGILGTGGDLPADQTTAGQAMQKVLLTATDAGLDTSLISQPIEVSPARDRLRRALGRGGLPQIAIRFGYGIPGHPTSRRTVTDFLDVPAASTP